MDVLWDLGFHSVLFRHALEVAYALIRLWQNRGIDLRMSSSDLGLKE